MPSLDTFEDFEAIPSSTDELSNSSDLEEETNPNNVIPLSNYAALSQYNLFFSKDHNVNCTVWVHTSFKFMCGNTEDGEFDLGCWGIIPRLFC